MSGANTLTVANAAGLVEAVKEYGAIVAKSGFFGCEKVEQGQALVLMAFSDGVPIGRYQEKYHILGNKLTMKAEHMRSELRRLGGEYRWIKDGDDGQEAVLEIKYRGTVAQVRYSIDDAKREKLIKPKGNWETRPGDMLRARCSTKAIRMHASEVLDGMLSDEEAEAIGLDEPVTITAEPVQALPNHDPEKEYRYEPVGVYGKATGQQIATLSDLFQQLNIHPDSQLAAMKKRGATDMSDLSTGGAADIIASLQTKLDQATDAESKSDDSGHTQPSNGPCDQHQINQIKSLIKQLAQTDGEAEPNKIKAHLLAHGLKLADLSRSEADELLQGLAVKNMEAFFNRSLTGAAKNE